MHQTRRNILIGLGTAATLGVGATQVFGQSRLDIDIQEVNDEGEYVVFVNNGSEKVDISGYWVAFEYGNEGTDQRKQFGDTVTIPERGTLKVATGAEEVPNADVTFDYERSALRNNGSDVVALLTPDGEEVATSEDAPQTTTTETTTTTTEDSGENCPDVEIEAVGTTDPDEDDYATFRVTNHENRDLRLGYSNTVTGAVQGKITVAANSETTFDVHVNTYGRVELHMWVVDGSNNCFPTVKNKVVDDDGKPGSPSPTTTPESGDSDGNSDSGGSNTTTTTPKEDC